MKRLILTLVLCLLLAIGVSAAEVDALYINCRVQNDGSAEYSMAVSCRFDKQTKSFTVPLAGEGIGDVTVSGASFDLKHSDDWVRAVLHSGDGFIGRQTFVVNYRAAAPESASERYALWLVSSRWEQDIKEISFQVEMPAPLETKPTLTSGYSGELFDAVQLSGTGFTGTLDGGLMAHESLTAEMTLPSGYFTQQQLRRLLSLDWGLVAMTLLTALCVLYWALRLRSRRPTVRTRVLPPEGWTPAEVPVILSGGQADAVSRLLLWGQLGYLYADFAGGELVLGQRMTMGSERPAYESELFRRMFEGRREFWVPDRRFYAAAVQSARAARRLWRARLFDRRGGNPALLRLGAALMAGAASAAAAVALLPKGAAWVLLGILAFLPGVLLGNLVQRAAGELRRRPWPHLTLIPGAAALILLALLGGGQLLYMLLALAMQVFAGWQLAFGGRRTEVGTEALGELLGLRRFLMQASPQRLRELLARDPSYVQTILPYAEQLGLARQVAARFGTARIEEPAWLRTDEPPLTPSELAKQEAALLAQLRGSAGQKRRHLPL